MDFFQAQDSARARTHTLVLLFLAAVAAIIVAVYLIVHATVMTGRTSFDPAVFAMVAAGTSTLVGLGSLFRTMQLRRGGARVAELLGGRRIAPGTTDELERRYVNVVEEMALASGTPVPALFVLDHEAGINAFAAGYALDDAAVAVTRGALEQLDRDELQGVIAHEFSHILNGDMRLNIRLMGLLFGILLLAIIGRGLTRTSGRSRSRKGGNAQLALLGIGLMAIGYIGVFFGRLIQAAVSRQREYLADAAAVQFTRNPHGIAGALAKIGGAAGSRIENHHAQEASHLFFASGLRRSASSLFATHPPLNDRISRIDPNFAGALIEPTTAGAAAVAPGIAAAAQPQRLLSIDALIASVGMPQPGHVAYARELLASLPRNVYDAAHSERAAPALLFALLLHGDGAKLHAQLEPLRALGGDELVHRTRVLAEEIAPLGTTARLPLLELLRPTLTRARASELERIGAAAALLIDVDDRVDPFESAVLQLFSRRLTLESPGGAAHAAATKTHSFDAVRTECEVVLSALAWSGSNDAGAAAASFADAVASLPKLGAVALRQRNELSTRLLSSALDRLRTASPAIRRAVLEACLLAVAHDGQIQPLEAEMVRAVAEGMDSPIPPVTATAPGVVRR